MGDELNDGENSDWMVIIWDLINIWFLVAPYMFTNYKYLISYSKYGIRVKAA
jgi:hypothetical protein